MAAAVHTPIEDVKIYVSTATLTLKLDPKLGNTVYAWHTEVLTPPASPVPTATPQPQAEAEVETVTKRKQQASNAATANGASKTSKPKPKSAAVLVTDFMAAERYHSALNRRMAAGSGSMPQSTNI